MTTKESLQRDKLFAQDFVQARENRADTSHLLTAHQFELQMSICRPALVDPAVVTYCLHLEKVGPRQVVVDLAAQPGRPGGAALLVAAPGFEGLSGGELLFELENESSHVPAVESGDDRLGGVLLGREHMGTFNYLTLTWEGWQDHIADRSLQDRLEELLVEVVFHSVGISLFIGGDLDAGYSD